MAGRPNGVHVAPEDPLVAGMSPSPCVPYRERQRETTVGGHASLREINKIKQNVGKERISKMATF